ncbi:GLPGLI family protein [Corchorus olitorius]|uniref:GLPGLI family protein n=1 Tax=Corchorus olitorius TaxID=93759 RepID=A0A1R3L3X3_9ROSI|nr:GLPGLI family protein [Corchorus olitorius]
MLIIVNNLLERNAKLRKANVKHLRQGLKKFSGGKALDPISDIGTGGGCDPGHGCTCGAIYNNFTPGIRSLTVYGKALSHRFIYSYSFAPDSAKTDSMITEYTRLDVFQDHSEFLSDVGAKKDSAISSAVRNRQSQADIKLPDGKYANKTFKSKELIYTIEYIGIQPFKVIRDQKLNWKLSDEKKKIRGYNCQKAFLNYGGRKWEAWFTADIPFQDGPYVFNGLPGLIVQMRDAENQHSFLLVENFKVPDVKTNLINKPYFVPVEVSEAQFNKKWNEYRKNPVGATEQFNDDESGPSEWRKF